MTRYSGNVGYGTSVQTAPGIWEDVIVEYSYFGDVLRNTRQSREGENVNNDLSVSNSISILADAYARANFLSIRYIWWSGIAWTVSDVEVRERRLIITLGSVYNGPKAPTTSTP